MPSQRAMIVTLDATLWVLPMDMARSAPPPTPLGPGFNAGAYIGQLRVTTFASGLNYPTSMQQYGGGILVGTTNNGPFLPAGGNTGRLLLLTDTNNDGVADQTADLTPVGGLPGQITAVRQAGNLLFVTDNSDTPSPVISVLQQGATSSSPFISVGTINLSFSSSSWMHSSFGLAVRPTPNQSGKYDVFFNLGSRTNQTSDAGNFVTFHATANTTGNATGLTNVALDPESIYKTTVSFNGTTAAMSTPVKIAAGLRNAVGMAFQPGTGDLYYADNGIDGSSANGHPNDKYGNAADSLDTLHTISASQIGVSFPNTNFATDFYDAAPTTFTKRGNPDAIAHFAPFGPFDASDHNSSPNESEGPNEIAFAPASFPAGLNSGIFIGFHGQFDKVGAPNATTGAGNEENPVVFYDLTTGTYWHFIGTQEPNIGHLDGMLSTSDALFMSDMADGSLFSAPTSTGAIYKVVAINPGDYNQDGIVDAADYIVWRKTVGQSGAGLAADGNHNGSIDSGDFDVWRAHFGQTAGSGAGTMANGSVPEPTALVLLMLAAKGWCLRRGRAAYQVSATH
jgi:hypothetical protein